MLAAQSGIDETDFNDGSNTFTIRMQATGAGRLVHLADAPFLCGIGFGRFGGTGEARAYLGGSLATEGPYGTTAAFDALGGELPTLGVAENQATLGFLTESIPLDGLSNEWRFAYEAGPATLDVDQWFGEPTWMLAGVSVPVPAPGCPRACPSA